MSALNRRLHRLEGNSPAGECEECGLAPGVTFEGYEVDWHDEEGDDPRPEWCEACGRQTTFVVSLRDLEPGSPGEGVR